jgi:hypothetical protein
MTTPFIIYALPRSRTAWLSKFLSYGEWTCYHEQTAYANSLEEVSAFFSHPHTGTAETVATTGRALLKHHIPGLKEVVILRPIEEVIRSANNIYLGGEFVLDQDILRKGLIRAERELRRISEDKNVLTVKYEDLNKEDACVQVFEFCLPYKFDKDWWESLRYNNIQVDTLELLRYRRENIGAFDAFKKHCRDEMKKMIRNNISFQKAVA